MGSKASAGKRNWSKDNGAEGAFEEKMDEFLSREEILTALEAANECKVGAPYKVPDAVIGWAMDHVASGMGYRTVARKLSGRLKVLGFEGITYSALHKRGKTLTVMDGDTDVNDARVMGFGTGAPPRSRPVVLAIDSTGLSPDRPSGWKVYHWNLSFVRGWYKLHAAVDTESGEILAYVITEPYYSDALAFDRLMDIVLATGHDVVTVLADAAYDSKCNWNRMKDAGIEFIANVTGCLDPKKRSCGTGRFRGCAVRAKHVLRILEVGREKWKEEVGYGRRWRVEGCFSDLKRLFGDTVRARSRDRVAEIIARMVRVYNLYKGVRASLRSRN